MDYRSYDEQLKNFFFFIHALLRSHSPTIERKQKLLLKIGQVDYSDPIMYQRLLIALSSMNLPTIRQEDAEILSQHIRIANPLQTYQDFIHKVGFIRTKKWSKTLTELLTSSQIIKEIFGEETWNKTLEQFFKSRDRIYKQNPYRTFVEDFVED